MAGRGGAASGSGGGGVSTAAPERKGFNPARHVQSLTDCLNRPWGWIPVGVAGCGHREAVHGCVFCILEKQHRETNALMLARVLDAERLRLQEGAHARVQRRDEWLKANRGKVLKESMRVLVEDVLHAAGIVEVRMGRRAPLSVHPEGIFGRALRDDEMCEIVQQAEQVLKATYAYRTHVTWDTDPPVLYMAAVPAMVGLGL
jgi:hypothetical protein